MRTLLHDLEPAELRRVLPGLGADIKVIERGAAEPKHCVGCFGCWTKTPGHCVIRDGRGDYSVQMGKSDEYIIISRVVYGGFSPFVKTILDRNIGYMLPYFSMRNGEMHHLARYPRRVKFTVVGYGADMTADEKDTFRALVVANGMNFETRENAIHLLREPAELAGIKEVFA